MRGVPPKEGNARRQVKNVNDLLQCLVMEQLRGTGVLRSACAVLSELSKLTVHMRSPLA